MSTEKVVGRQEQQEEVEPYGIYRESMRLAMAMPP